MTRFTPAPPSGWVFLPEQRVSSTGPAIAQAEAPPTAGESAARPAPLSGRETGQPQLVGSEERGGEEGFNLGS